jgi:hypothetical protein
LITKISNSAGAEFGLKRLLLCNWFRDWHVHPYYSKIEVMLKTPNAYLQCFAIKTAVAFFKRVAKSTVLQNLSHGSLRTAGRSTEISKAVLCCSKHQQTTILCISMLVDGAMLSTMQGQLEIECDNCSVCVRWQIDLIPASMVLLAAHSKNATAVFIAKHCICIPIDRMNNARAGYLLILTTRSCTGYQCC